MLSCVPLIRPPRLQAFVFDSSPNCGFSLWESTQNQIHQLPRDPWKYPGISVFDNRKLYVNDKQTIWERERKREKERERKREREREREMCATNWECTIFQTLIVIISFPTDRRADQKSEYALGACHETSSDQLTHQTKRGFSKSYKKSRCRDYQRTNVVCSITILCSNLKTVVVKGFKRIDY